MIGKRLLVLSYGQHARDSNKPILSSHASFTDPSDPRLLLRGWTVSLFMIQQHDR